MKQKLKYPTELPSWKGLSFLPDGKTVRKTYSWGYEEGVTTLISLLSYLKKNPHPTIVPILDYQFISSIDYSYDMPLMAMLSASEYELVDLYTAGPNTRRDCKDRIYRLKKKHPKLFQVVKKLTSWESYVDLHAGNIMRDRYGNYKLIDLEGFNLTQLLVNDIINDITKR